MHRTVKYLKFCPSQAMYSSSPSQQSSQNSKSLDKAVVSLCKPAKHECYTVLCLLKVSISISMLFGSRDVPVP